jgi:hypothetical protein
MDLLYILGKGSPYNNEELKYSLRSLERFGDNIGQLVLIGEKPDYLDYTKVIHHPFEESGEKEYRIASKILHACTIGALKSDFLFCNDDFFFLKPFDCNTFPYYQKGNLYNGQSGTAYSDHLKLTRDYLLSHGKTATHFDVHCPIIYNAAKFIELTDAWQHSKETIGMVVKSTYANMCGVTGKLYDDVKLSQLQTANDFSRMYLNECFSIYDQSWNRGVSKYLMETFTKKSQWEL